MNNQGQRASKLAGDSARVKHSAGAPKFLADHMLGRLARWLRALGYDTEFDRTLDDPQLALKAAREDRVLLTRDSGLVKRRMVRRWVLIESGQLAAQLRQLIRELELPQPTIHVGRCMACNGDVEAVDRRDAASHVPEFVARTQHRFHRCTRCGRYYWAGTHLQKMQEKLREVLSQAT